MQFYEYSFINTVLWMRFYGCSFVNAVLRMQFYGCSFINAVLRMQFYGCCFMDAVLLKDKRTRRNYLLQERKPLIQSVRQPGKTKL